MTGERRPRHERVDQVASLRRRGRSRKSGRCGGDPTGRRRVPRAGGGPLPRASLDEPRARSSRPQFGGARCRRRNRRCRRHRGRAPRAARTSRVAEGPPSPSAGDCDGRVLAPHEGHTTSRSGPSAENSSTPWHCQQLGVGRNVGPDWSVRFQVDLNFRIISVEAGEEFVERQPGLERRRISSSASINSSLPAGSLSSSGNWSRYCSTRVSGRVEAILEVNMHQLDQDRRPHRLVRRQVILDLRLRSGLPGGLEALRICSRSTILRCSARTHL